jgi:hypothetical protein
MQLINNQIFYNLENYLDMESFDKINDKITYALSKNWRHFRTSGTTQNTLYDQSTLSVYKKRDQLLKEMPSLLKLEALFYAKLSGTVTLGNNFILRGTKRYPAKYVEKHLSKSAELQPFDNQFKFLYDWIDAQNCFTEYGRVLFWVNEPCQKTAFHQDYPTNNVNYKDVKDSFIWLTGIVPKKLVIKDPDTGETHHSTSRACVFNTNNIHSSLGHPECTAWSLRIDGNFNKDWAIKAGIADYYNV